MYQKLLKGIEDKGKMPTVKKGIKVSNLLSKVGIDVKKRLFHELHENLGGQIRLMVAGGAALNPTVEKGFISTSLLKEIVNCSRTYSSKKIRLNRKKISKCRN